ncbi:MAG: hypothetical protein ACRD1Z_12135 [Vicinamibacteria bacterium]
MSFGRELFTSLAGPGDVNSFLLRRGKQKKASQKEQRLHRQLVEQQNRVIPTSSTEIERSRILGASVLGPE